MSVIKRCKRCGQKVPHHHELDVLCMSCELMEYPSSNPQAYHYVNILSTNAKIGHDLNKQQKFLKRIKRILL